MSNFWDMVWLMISTFFFVAYLIIMFQIVVDLFRDHELGGGSKVLWVIGLIFIPVLTAIIYIIARGKGMATRQQASLQKAKAETETYIKEVAGKSPAQTSPTPRRCSTPAPSRRASSTSSRPRLWPEKQPRSPNHESLIMNKRNFIAGGLSMAALAVLGSGCTTTGGARATRRRSGRPSMPRPTARWRACTGKPATPRSW